MTLWNLFLSFAWQIALWEDFPRHERENQGSESCLCISLEPEFRFKVQVYASVSEYIFVDCSSCLLYSCISLLIPLNLTLLMSFLTYDSSYYCGHMLSFLFPFRVLKNNAFIPPALVTVTLLFQHCNFLYICILSTFFNNVIFFAPAPLTCLYKFHQRDLLAEIREESGQKNLESVHSLPLEIQEELPAEV